MPCAIRSAASADDFAIRDDLKLLHDQPGLEEEFADFLEEKDRAVGGFRHEFFPPCIFMAAGSVAKREGFKPENELRPLLRAGCKGIYPIQRRQRPTLGVRATSGDILPAERVIGLPVFLTTRVPGG